MTTLTSNKPAELAPSVAKELEEAVRTVSPAHVLRVTKELLRNPTRWIKFAQAVDQDNRIISIHSNQAYRYCLAGAFLRAQTSFHQEGVPLGIGTVGTALTHLIAAVQSYSDFDEIENFNDGLKTSHADVLREAVS